MNYMEARELSDKSGWHMTVRNDNRVWAHQCCRDSGPPATEEDVRRFGYKLGEPTLGKPHAPHPTREEAEECYHQWRLRRIEETVEFSDALSPDWHSCAVCGAPTKGGVWYDDDHLLRHLALCPDHRTARTVLDGIKRVTGLMYS